MADINDESYYIIIVEDIKGFVPYFINSMPDDIGNYSRLNSLMLFVNS